MSSMVQHDIQLYQVPMLRVIDGDRPETGGDDAIPIPISALVTHREDADGSVIYGIEKAWRTADAMRCELCPRHLCTAHHFPSGYSQCKIVGYGRVSPAEAALHGLRSAASSSAAAS